MSVIPSYTMLCEMPNSDFLKFFLKKQMKKQQKVRQALKLLILKASMTLQHP